MAFPGYPPQFPNSGAPNPSQGGSYPGMPPTMGFGIPSQQPPYPGVPMPNPGFPQQSYAPQLPQGGFAAPPGGQMGAVPFPGQQAGPAMFLAGHAPYPSGAGVSAPCPSGGHYASQYTATGTQQPQKSNPTIRPKVPYGPVEEEADAAALRKAMKGLCTDEKAIIAVLSKRTNQQRQLIAKRFVALYGKDLVKDLKSELSGKLEDTVIACMTPLDQFYAKELHDAMAGLGTTESTLIEVLCTLNNARILSIKNAYKLKYSKDLESDIKGDTSGHFGRLLHSLCQGLRDENPQVNLTQVSTDVQSLYAAGEGKFGTDESIFNSVLVTRSLPHLREVFKMYQQTHGKTMEKVIASEFSGCIKDGLLAIVKSANNCSEYFAEKLYDSMAGMGTNDRALIRLIVTRSEYDLVDIKVAFQRKYGKSLESFIEGDCSGDYKKMLIAMVTGC